MTSSKDLIKQARKWQKLTAIRRKRILLERGTKNVENSRACIASLMVADEGHFIVYTADQRRFMVPLEYLDNEIFRELLKLSEEEFGLPSDGPITLPCDTLFMEYIVLLIKRGAASRDLEIPLLMSVATSSSGFCQEQMNQQFLVCSF